MGDDELAFWARESEYERATRVIEMAHAFAGGKHLEAYQETLTKYGEALAREDCAVRLRIEKVREERFAANRAHLAQRINRHINQVKQ
jgi:hypothetical protein